MSIAAHLLNPWGHDLLVLNGTTGTTVAETRSEVRNGHGIDLLSRYCMDRQ